MDRSLARSAGAVVAGLVATIVVTTLVDVVLHVTKVYPGWEDPIDDRLAALATAYRVVITVAAAWLTARLAPSRPLAHTVVLGILGTLLGTLGWLATRGKGLGPDWYAPLLAILAMPQCLLGGWFFVRTRPAATA